MCIVYEHIKDLYSFSKQNKFGAFLIILTLHICTWDDNFQIKPNQLLYTEYDMYILVELLVFAACKFIIILIYASVLLKGLFYLFFSIEFEHKKPFINQVGEKYQKLLHFGNTALLLVLPSLLIGYFLLIIMSVHNSWEHSLNYVIKQFSFTNLIILLLLHLPYVMAWVYNEKTDNRAH